MSLVDYSSSEDEQPLKKQRVELLPPLPLDFIGREPDATAQHEHRVRSIPHVVGNWSTHVYLDGIPTLYYMIRVVVDASISEAIQELLQALEPEQHGLHVKESLTLSLSKLCIMRRFQYDALQDTLMDELRSVKP
jgi:hypothetical protein